jgi:hypothetical protein
MYLWENIFWKIFLKNKDCAKERFFKILSSYLSSNAGLLKKTNSKNKAQMQIHDHMQKNIIYKNKSNK